MRARDVALARLAVGSAMVLRPGLPARLLGAPVAGAHPVLRVLGLRHLLQGSFTLAEPSRDVATASAGVDAAHALSCLLLAAASRGHRRTALRGAAFAGGWMAATWVTRPAPLPPAPAPEPLRPGMPYLVLPEGGSADVATDAAHGAESVVPLPGGELVVGRGRDADLRLADPTVSPRHLLLATADGRTRLDDLASLNGTRVNGAVVSTAQLHDGDRIDLGGSTLVYRSGQR